MSDHRYPGLSTQTSPAFYIARFGMALLLTATFIEYIVGIDYPIHLNFPYWDLTLAWFVTTLLTDPHSLAYKIYEGL